MPTTISSSVANLAAFAKRLRARGARLRGLSTAPGRDLPPSHGRRSRNALYALLALGALAPAGALAEPSARSPTTTPRPAHERAVSAWLKGHLGASVELYKHLHQHPELSLNEVDTAAMVAAKLRAAGYAVHEKVGGHGVVGLLRNGAGPTLLLRGDMDALPIVEETGLPYASRRTVKGERGGEVGVMHACGHDIHVANLLGTAALLAAEKKLWRGTLLIVAQPAEELGRGAAMMIDDGLFKRFPRPDFAIALHVDSEIAAGKVGVLPGWATANVDAVDITVFGRGGHGARPHESNDPIVTAAYLVGALQTLVSRRLDPQQPGVVTVGSFHAGTKHNVIPNEAKLQLTVRSYTDAVRKQLLDGIAQLSKDVCQAFRCPKPPVVAIRKEFTPAGYNDPELAAAARRVFEGVLGGGAVTTPAATMGGEDFARYGRVSGARGLLFRLGTTDARTLDKRRRKPTVSIPGLHSSRYAPEPEAALRTGIRAMGSLALALLAAP